MFFLYAINWLKRTVEILIYMGEGVDFLTEDSQTQNHDTSVGRVREEGRVSR